MIVATSGSVPPAISVAATAAPSGKLPSGVMSGKRSTRDAMYTPHASAEKASPRTRAESQKRQADDASLIFVVAGLADSRTRELSFVVEITSLARATSSGGIVTPKSLAAPRSTTMRGFADRWKGIFAGLSP